MSQKKLHRWEKSSDRITIISLDAIPEVLWEGTLNELKAMEQTSWVKHFQARTDYAACTDVTAAFQLAVAYLKGDPRYVRKYLFVFSDLIDEPPVDSIYTPRKPSRLPSGDFPWDALRDVSVSAFWVPPDQKLAWHRAIEQHDLAANFALYTTSESSEVSIQPPPTVELEVTEAERKAARKHYFSYAVKLGVGAGIFLVFLVSVSLTAFFVIRHTRRARPVRVPAQRLVRPLQQTTIRRPGDFTPSDRGKE